MPKDEVEASLLALAGNEPVRAQGLEHRRVQVELEGRPEEVELTLLRAGPEGPPAAPPVVLVHGTPGSLFTWVELIFGGPDFEGLAATREVWAFDVIGHGTTRTSTPPYSFQRCADLVAGAIEALGLRRVVLVGHSYGGEFCWRAALDHPELVERLVLIDTSGYARAPEEFLPEEVAMRENPLARIGYLLNSRERIRTAYQPHFREPVPDERVEELYLACDNRDNWRAMVELARDENGDRQGELGDLKTPTLLVWGAEDIAYPPESYGRRFERDLPAAWLELVPECGHYPHEERPAEVARILRAYLDE
jgi:pimeloyl-ACP methyl ester carboxylesterase